MPQDKNFAALQVPISESGVMNLDVDGNLAEWDNVPSVFWVTHDDLVESITLTDAEAFYRTYYTPNNMVTAVVGAVGSRFVYGEGIHATAIAR